MLTACDMVIFHSSQWYLLQEAFPVSASPTPNVLISIFTALVIGLLIAFALQFLLTILGIAIGISALGNHPAKEASQAFQDEQVDEPLREENPKKSSTSDADQKSLISTLGIPAGLGVLLTVNLVLFSACFLAARFSQIDDPGIGAIEGIVLWSAYFLVLLWISFNAVTSFFGSVLDLTSSGFRRLVATVTAAFQPSADELPTEAELIDRIRQEIRTALLLKDWQLFDSDTLFDRNKVFDGNTASPRSLPAPAKASSNFIDASTHHDEPQSLANEPDREVEQVSPVQQIALYLYTAPAKKLTPKRVDRKFKAMLHTLPMEPGQNHFPKLDRAILTQILAQRTDLSDKQKKRVMQKVTATWTDFAEEKAHLIAIESDGAPDQASPPPSETEIAPEDLDVDLRSPQLTQSQLTQSQLTHLLGSVMETTLNRALANLPDLVPQIKATLPTGMASGTAFAPLVFSIALGKVREAIDAIEFSTLDPDLVQQNLDRVMDVSQAGLTTLNRSIMEQMEQWRDRSIQQLDSIQQLAQTQVDTIKQQAQARLEATRKAAALAAWWLFLTASTAALSAALAGALATGLSLPHLIPFRG